MWVDTKKSDETRKKEDRERVRKRNCRRVNGHESKKVEREVDIRNEGGGER